MSTDDDDDDDDYPDAYNYQPKERKAPVLPCEWRFIEKWNFAVTHMWEELWELLSPGRMLPESFVWEFLQFTVPGVTAMEIHNVLIEAVRVKEFLGVKGFERENGKEFFFYRPDVLLPDECRLDYTSMGS